MDFPKRNNLQWLRLAFALQVVIVHAFEHLAGHGLPLISRFPGVPAFFFVSGFLVYASYRNAPGRRYFENRLLRLFPGLLSVTVGGAAVVLAAHGWHDLLVNPRSYGLWFATQLTLGQWYTPRPFRDVGIGGINGSLWTLTTEITFYCCVPVIVWLERRFRHTVPALVAASFAVYALGPTLLSQRLYRSTTAYDLLALTPAVWGWMFGFGILAVKHFDRVARGLRFFPLAAVPMALMIAAGRGALFATWGNRLGLFYFVAYAAMVTWLAFGTRYVKLEADFSYGTYVWHMPLINLMLVLATPRSIPLAIASTMAVAVASWYVVERPSLRLKRRSLLRDRPGAPAARPAASPVPVHVAPPVQLPQGAGLPGGSVPRAVRLELGARDR